MSWAQYLPPDRVNWTQSHWAYPIWPSEPDLNVIKEVVASNLGEEEDDFTVQFLANGANHKVYDVFHPSWSKAYLFRIAIPIDPRLKMESEMATMQFLSHETTIPVPKPVAWCSSAEGRLGYEWALVEKIPGVTLEKIWHNVPWEKKVEITETIAGFLVQLWAPDMRFDKIGSLYPAQARQFIPICEEDKGEKNLLTVYSPSEMDSLHLDYVEHPSRPAVEPVEDSNEETLLGHHPSEDMDSLNRDHSESSGHINLERVEDNDEESQSDDDLSEKTHFDFLGKRAFTVGPSVDGAFFSQRRRYLTSNRGPYESCHEWQDALIHVEHELIRTSKILLECKEDMTPEHRAEKWDDLEYEIGFDEEDMEEYDDMIALCHKYLHLLPLVFPPHETQEGKMSCVLYHHDLSASNILVDPETFTVTGIIDWEQTCVVPDWYGIDYPLFINPGEPFTKGEPRVPKTYDEGSPDYDDYTVDNRNRWEAKQLRKSFDLTVEKLSGLEDWRSVVAEDDQKPRFISGVADLAEHWLRARNELKRIEKTLDLTESLEEPEKDSSESESEEE